MSDVIVFVYVLHLHVDNSTADDKTEHFCCEGKQKRVASTLSSMGLDVREEAVDEVSGTRWTHCWTVLDSASPLAPEHVGKCKAGWAVEVEGPSHFVRSSDGAPHCSGSTLLKRRHLEGLGYALVSVPFWEWRAAERVRYLRKKLGLRTTGRQNAEE